MSVDICSSPTGWLRHFCDQLNNLVFGNKFQSITATDSIGQQAGIILVNATGGAVIATLPAVADVPVGKTYTVKKTNATNTVTVEGAGAETIDGAANVVLTAQYDFVSIVSNGTAWFIVAETDTDT